MLEQISDCIWVAEEEFSLLGLHIGKRMTVVRLKDGKLLLHSPISMNELLLQELKKLGEIAYLVSPNLFHHLHINEWTNIEPKPIVYAPPHIEKKQPQLKVDFYFSEDLKPSWQEELEIYLLKGTRAHETIFFHKESKTLIVTDLVMNFHHQTSLWERLMLSYLGTYKKLGCSKLFRAGIKDKKVFQRSIYKIYSLDFETIIMSHGKILKNAARYKFSKAFEWLI